MLGIKIFEMKISIIIVPVLIMFSACMFCSCSKKDVIHPPKFPDNEFPDMLVTELHDIEVTQNKHQILDLDKDGVNDVVFATWLIGDPVEHEDELLFFAARFQGKIDKHFSMSLTIAQKI